MSEKDGGPAFPVPGGVMTYHTHNTSVPFIGMTLRDYFAAKAMMTFYDAPGMLYVSAGGDTIDTPEAVAEFAYRLADAMLAERAK